MKWGRGKQNKGKGLKGSGSRKQARWGKMERLTEGETEKRRERIEERGKPNGKRKHKRWENNAREEERKMATTEQGWQQWIKEITTKTESSPLSKVRRENVVLAYIHKSSFPTTPRLVTRNFASRVIRAWEEIAKIMRKKTGRYTAPPMSALRQH